MEAALWSAIAIVAAVSAGTVFVLLGRIDGLTSRVAARLDGLATRVDGLTTEIGTQATAGSVRIDGLASEMRGRFDRADDRFDRIAERLSRVERELRRHVGRHAGWVHASSAMSSTYRPTSLDLDVDGPAQTRHLPMQRVVRSCGGWSPQSSSSSRTLECSDRCFPCPSHVSSSSHEPRFGEEVAVCDHRHDLEERGQSSSPSISAHTSVAQGCAGVRVWAIGTDDPLAVARSEVTRNAHGSGMQAVPPNGPMPGGVDAAGLNPRGSSAMRARTTSALLAFLYISHALAGVASAAPGDLDGTFSGDGVARTNLTNDAPVLDEALGVAVQDDGRIVAVGAAGGAGGRFAAVRYLPGGPLDDSFGGDGKVLTDVARGEDAAADVALQDDGRIVVVGRSSIGRGAFTLVRYRSGGGLDRTFGGDGIVVTDITPGNDGARAVAIQGDGRIVVAGRAGDGFVVARYRPGGALDASFAGDGIRQTDFTPRQDLASAIAIQDDGRIVVAGTGGIKSVGSNSQFAAARYTTSGMLDPTFGGDGTTLFNLSSFGDFGSAVAIQPTGEIVVAGTASLGGADPDAQLGVVRFLSDGSPDFTFSDDAVHQENPTSRPDLGHAVALQADGAILVAGTSTSINSCCASRAVVIRLTADGDEDAGFSGGAVVTTSEVAQGANDMALDGDGKVVLVGRAGVDTSVFAVLRLLAS